MPKFTGSAIGIEIGPCAAKAVSLSRSGGRVELVRWAAEESSEFVSAHMEERVAALRRLAKSLGVGSKEVGMTIAFGNFFVRLLEQPETPVAVLREALRINGPVLFNFDCRDYVMDCALVDRAKPVQTGEEAKRRYLAGGILRAEVETLAEACKKAGISIGCIQIVPASTLNAFEQGCPEAFGGSGFLLLDVSHAAFTMMAGSGQELLLLRALEGGMRVLKQHLTSGGTISEAQVLSDLKEGDVLMRERVRGGLTVLVRQILASVGFLESRVGGEVTQVHVSGGGAIWSQMAGILSEELQMECVSWSPLGAGVPLPAGVPPGLHGACGAALQMMGLPAGQ
jgi:Tfp pilus assembly PilM family ATPase